MMNLIPGISSDGDVQKAFWKAIGELIANLLSLGTYGLAKKYHHTPETLQAANEAMDEAMSSTGAMHLGGPVWAHRGLGVRDVPAILQAGEAVIPNPPAKYQGMSTDGRGNIAGGNTFNFYCQDAMTFMDFMKRHGIGALIDLMNQGACDAKGRSLARAIGR